MFDLLHTNAIPATPKTIPTKTTVDIELTEDIFIELYGKSGSKEKTKARNLYEDNPVLDIGLGTLYTLPAKKKLHTESDESIKQDEYFRAFNKIFDNIETTAKYVEKKKGWWIFGDRSMYDIGKQFLSDVANTIGTHFTSITQPKAANLSAHSFTKYVQLKLLQDSPRAFIQSQKNTLLTSYTDPITSIRKNLWRASKSADKVDMNTLHSMATQIKKIEQSTQTKVITDEINRLENSWSRFFFGWYNGDNKKLTDLKQIQATAPIIQEHAVELVKEISAQCTIELAKHRFIDLHQKLCDHADTMSLDELKEWQDNMAILVDNKKLISSLIEPKIIALENAIKKNIKAIFDHNSTASTDQIEKILKTQFMALSKRTTNNSKTIEQYIDILLESVESPDVGTRFSERMLMCIPNDINAELNTLLTTKKEQFDAWSTLRALTITGDTNTTFDADAAHLALLTLLSKPMTAGMKQDVSKFLTHYIKDVSLHMTHVLKTSLTKQTADTKKHIALLRQQLKLLSLEKLQPLRGEQVNLLMETRQHFTQLITAHIHSIGYADLEAFSILLEDLWPDGIIPKYVRITNTSTEPFTWAMTQLSSTLPDHIICDKNAIKQFKPLISDITLQPKEERLVYFVPRVEDTEIKKAIYDVRSELLKAYLDPNDIEKLTFLKENKSNIIYELFKKWCLDNDTPLTNRNLFAYGESLISSGFEKVYSIADKLACDSMAIEASWITSALQEQIEQIAYAFDQKLSALLNQEDLKKAADALKIAIDPIDLGHLLLQWRFINLLQSFYNFNFYQHVGPAAGTDMLQKMSSIAREEPNFIHFFLGSMNESQLETLAATFKYDTLWEDASKEYDTPLKQSTLLHQMTALIQQELLAYLNGDAINMHLFNDHLKFVLKQLEQQESQIRFLKNSERALELKEELLKGMTWLNTQEISPELKQLIIEQNKKLKETNNIIDYLKEFPQEIVRQLPPELKDFIGRAQYHFADFKSSLKALLSKNNITDNIINEKLHSLKDSPLYTLVDVVIRDNKDICRIFGIETYRPMSIPKINWGLVPTLTQCYNAPRKCISYLYQGASNAFFYLKPNKNVKDDKHISLHDLLDSTEKLDSNTASAQAMQVVVR